MPLQAGHAVAIVGLSGSDANLPAREGGEPIAGATGDRGAEVAAIRADAAAEALRVGRQGLASAVGADAASGLQRASGTTDPAEGQRDTTLAVIVLTAGFCIGFAIENTDGAAETSAFECGLIAAERRDGVLFCQGRIAPQDRRQREQQAGQDGRTKTREMRVSQGISERIMKNHGHQGLRCCGCLQHPWKQRVSGHWPRHGQQSLPSSSASSS